LRAQPHAGRQARPIPEKSKFVWFVSGEHMTAADRRPGKHVLKTPRELTARCLCNHLTHRDRSPGVALWRAAQQSSLKKMVSSIADLEWSIRIVQNEDLEPIRFKPGPSRRSPERGHPRFQPEVLTEFVSGESYRLCLNPPQLSVKG
jgi:hypothetical protein